MRRNSLPFEMLAVSSCRRLLYPVGTLARFSLETFTCIIRYCSTRAFASDHAGITSPATQGDTPGRDISQSLRIDSVLLDKDPGSEFRLGIIPFDGDAGLSDNRPRIERRHDEIEPCSHGPAPPGFEGLAMGVRSLEQGNQRGVDIEHSAMPQRATTNPGSGLA